mgnify:CR=1 FL=1
MALTSSGTISMSDMRTEFSISGAISMSDLYRGEDNVPSSVNTTVTVSEVSNVLCGAGSPTTANHGNTASPCGATATSYNYGYWRGGVAGSGSISWPDTYQTVNTFFYNASFAGSTPPETVIDLTFKHTATYHYTTVSYEATNGTFKIGTSSDDDSQVSDNLGSSGAGASAVVRYGTFSATAGTAVRFSIKLPYVGSGSNIYNAVYVNTALSSDAAGHIRSLAANAGVPASSTISFSDLYSALGS